MSGPGPSGSPPGSKILDRLAHEALITPEQHQRAYLHAQRGGGHCHDAIIEVGGITEGDLLKYLAGIFRTRFVTTAKLARASVTREAIALVPRKVADQLRVCPILLDPKSGELSVVAADIGEDDIEKQVQLVSRARDVRVYLARPAAVEALIRKLYDRDPYAFDELASQSPAAGRAPKPTARSAGPAAGYYEDPSTGSGLIDLAELDEREGTQSKGRKPEIRIEAPEIPRGRPEPRRPVSIAFEAPVVPEQQEIVAEKTELVQAKDLLEVLNVCVALLEQGREELRGHSGQVARLCRRLGERMGFDAPQMHGILVAAHLHDVGKASTYHLTALNVAQYEGHRIQAQKTHLTPLRMFESASLPRSTVDALTHLYERFDGRGFPDSRKGKEIPLGARILAVVETYADLTTHSKNPYRKVLSPQEACDAIARYKGQFFDPNIVDLFQRVVLGDDLKAKLLADRPTVLVVDPDIEETTVLELKMVEHGYEVAIARTMDKAFERVTQGGVDCIISEVELVPGDGFDLFQRVRASAQGREVPFLFLTRKSDSASVNRGFELGAADYLVKPASADVVAAKTRQVLDQLRARTTRGVSGSLSEMSLPDVVQVLSNGRKSGVLRIQSGGRSGSIDFADGAIWDARFGEAVAHEAFYEMLALADGGFVLDPTGRPTSRTIRESTETLLLEGMRRLDERHR